MSVGNAAFGRTQCQECEMLGGDLNVLLLTRGMSYRRRFPQFYPCKVTIIDDRCQVCWREMRILDTLDRIYQKSVKSKGIWIKSWDRVIDIRFMTTILHRSKNGKIKTAVLRTFPLKLCLARIFRGKFSRISTNVRFYRIFLHLSYIQFLFKKSQSYPQM